MKSISDITRVIVEKDEVLYEGLRQDILNLRAVGRIIRPKIEKIKLEKVGLETIVVSLSRIQSELMIREPIKPKVRLFDMTMQTPLTTITYPKESLSKDDLSKIRRLIDTNNTKFCTMTEGFKEVTVIVPATLAEQISGCINVSPSVIKNDLYAICLHFDPAYLNQPNILYAILGELAIERINLMEIISTATELSLIIESKELQKVTAKLNRLITQK